MVKASNLRGRGGAGFPTGRNGGSSRWDRERRSPKYLVCNADEMEPGTFKDRLLLEGNPHLLLEGMMLAAFAIEADVAYVFLRGDYCCAAERIARGHRGGVRARIISARTSSGSDFSLELHLHLSAGPLHVRRGDRPAQRARGQARQSRERSRRFPR